MSEMVTPSSRSDDYLRGYRHAARTAVAWLYRQADEMRDPHARTVLHARADDMGKAFKYGHIDASLSPQQDAKPVGRGEGI